MRDIRVGGVGFAEDISPTLTLLCNFETNVAPLIERSVAPLSPLHADRRHAMRPSTARDLTVPLLPSLQVSRNRVWGDVLRDSGSFIRTRRGRRRAWEHSGSLTPLGVRECPRNFSHQESFGGPQRASSASRKSNDWTSQTGSWTRVPEMVETCETFDSKSAACSRQSGREKQRQCLVPVTCFCCLLSRARACLC